MKLNDNKKHFHVPGVGGIILLVIFVFLICIVAGYIWRAFDKAYNRREVIVTVDDKWTKSTVGGQKYLVSCTDVNNEREMAVFEITDSTLAWRWDSSDLYATIEPGTVYKMEIGGGRVPIMSWYPNIYSAEELKYDGIGGVGETEYESGALIE